MALRAELLRKVLESHLPADDTEAGHLARMRELCESIADPFARESFEPGHFTASAFVLSPERDALLLIFHRKLALWLQPGGHVEPSDPDLLSAARREAGEEVGLFELTLELPGPLDLDVHAIPPRADEPGHAHFDVRFLFRAPTRALAVGSDVQAAQWVPLSTLSRERSDPSVMRAVEKLRRCRG